MENAKVTMELRLATGKDFTAINGQPLYGVMYFIEPALSKKIEPQPNYFTAETDKNTFKELFIRNQIYVPKRLFDEVTIEN